MLGKADSDGHPWFGFGLFTFVLSCIVGFSYIFYQWFLFSRVDDPLFVGILMANSYAIFKFISYLRTKIQSSSELFKSIIITSDPGFYDKELSVEIFNPMRGLLLGISFGSVFFIGIVFIMPWGEEIYLNYILALFLCLSNIITGMALYSLSVYFKYAILVGANIEVDLWDR